MGSGAIAWICYQVLMEEPSLHSSRLLLAGTVAAALLVGGAGFLLGRGTTGRPAPVVPPSTAPQASTPEASESAKPMGVLRRADLIALAARAADAAAGGEVDPQASPAEGRRFELLLPFGCAGPADEASNAAMRWRYDSQAGALRIHVAPVVWTVGDWWPEDAPKGTEAIEGFWISRPWTGSERCPTIKVAPAPAEGQPVALPAEALALGQLLSAGSSRQGSRDGKPYEAVVRIPEGEFDGSSGLQLRISGRIASLPGGDVVRCRQLGGSEQRPSCLVATVLDEVSIISPATGTSLATWDVAGPEGSAAE